MPMPMLAMSPRTAARFPLSLFLMVMFATAAWAGPGELTLVGSAPTQVALREALSSFKRDSGLEVEASFPVGSSWPARLGGNDHPDVVVATQADMDALERAGKTQPGTRQTLARARLGLAVRQGRAVPDVRDAAALRQVLLQARSLVVADPAEEAGRQAQALLDAMGLTEALRARTRHGAGSNPLAAVGFGEVELGLHPVPGILAAPGVALAARVPADLHPATRYDIAIVREAPNLDDARRLIVFLVGSEARAVYTAAGFEAPGP